MDRTESDPGRVVGVFLAQGLDNSFLPYLLPYLTWTLHLPLLHRTDVGPLVNSYNVSPQYRRCQDGYPLRENFPWYSSFTQRGSPHP